MNNLLGLIQEDVVYDCCLVYIVNEIKGNCGNREGYNLVYVFCEEDGVGLGFLLIQFCWYDRLVQIVGYGVIGDVVGEEIDGEEVVEDMFVVVGMDCFEKSEDELVLRVNILY